MFRCFRQYGAKKESPPLYSTIIKKQNWWPGWPVIIHHFKRALIEKWKPIDCSSVYVCLGQKTTSSAALPSFLCTRPLTGTSISDISVGYLRWMVLKWKKQCLKACCCHSQRRVDPAPLMFGTCSHASDKNAGQFYPKEMRSSFRRGLHHLGQ